jgi:hypothetical protein
MIPRDKELKLIKIYMYICDLYEYELKYSCQRFSNNSNPEFTDQEILTIYLFTGSCQNYYQIKDIHTFANEYLRSWFPKLPSYQTFNYRLNLLSEVFRNLGEKLISSFRPLDCDLGISLTDSLPIITSAGRNRTGKVAQQITDKGFCSTKNMYYFGMKLHALAFHRKGTIPFPEKLIFTPAGENDLVVSKQFWGETLTNRTVFADKAYSDKEFFNEAEATRNLKIHTPVKAVKGESELIRQREKAYDELYSTAVSKVRQPIESFFNWLNEKTKIQRAMKVRSQSGLLIHTMGKIAIAFISLIF